MYTTPVNLINKSLGQVIFPQLAQKSNIWPIIKSKDRLNVVINLLLFTLPVIRKVYEKCLLIVDSMTISSLTIQAYYHSHNLVFDYDQALKKLSKHSLTIF